MALQDRHEILRTTFTQINGTGVQVIGSTQQKDLEVIDTSSDEGDMRLLQLQHMQMESFNLETETGWRVCVFRLEKDNHLLSIVMHRIISDEFSVDILGRELATFYSAAINNQGHLSQIEPLPMQYREFAVWQNQQGKTGQHQDQVDYWVKQLEGNHPATFLGDRPRKAVMSGVIERQDIEIGGSLYIDLLRFCKVYEATSFATLLAVFRIAHYRLTGAEDATVGSLMANRNQQGLKGMIGLFTNLQCIRIRVEDDISFEQLVHQVDETAAEAHKNQDIPFETIVSELHVDASDGSRHPIVQTSFSLHSTRDMAQFAFEDLETERLNVVATTRMDVEFHLFQEAECLRGSVFFAADLYDHRTIHAMIDIFYKILTRGLEAPQTPVASLELMDSNSVLRDMSLLEINRTTYARESSVIEVFRRQVSSYPSFVAVKDSVSELTYAQLDERSDLLAVWLAQFCFAAETLVGVLAPRSCHAIIALLGILKANLAYIPLDVKVPKSRIEAILSAVSSHKLVLLGADVPPPDTQLVDVEFVSIADILNVSIQTVRTLYGLGTASSALSAPSATSLAYVMFTSGSTGKPKGVMIEHRGIVRTADVLSQTWGAAPVAQMANLAFDTSTAEIYTPLLNGGMVVCIDDVTALDSAKLKETFVKERIEVAVFTPAFLKQCLAASPATMQTLRVLYVAGDRFDAQDASKALGLVKGGVFNSYGPTENSVMSTSYRIPPDEMFVNGVPIGRAVDNSGAYVMDPQQHLVPIGVLGELVVTGDGVARGYTDPERDQDRFVQVVIDGESVRAYRTGDCVRYRPSDGQLEFFGRMDYQVKIRGHRVELPEVEHALLTFESVSEAVTVVRNGGEQDTELISFITISERHGLSEWEGADDTDQQGQIDTWRDHFDVTAYADIDDVDPKSLGRDFVGWTSMYDGSEIDKKEMEEWLDDTLTALLDGNEPRNVLEVGTGSGMILFNLPNSLESYIGFELAEKAATFANKAAHSVPSLRGKVEVRTGTVTDLASMQKLNTPDLAVVNSTAQYFPTPEYLLRVVEDILRLDGIERLFFGDLRSYALYREFQVTKALYTTGGRSTHDELRQRMETIEREEEELLVDPAFFTALRVRLPDLVSHVEILPKKMRAVNELSCYRYAAIIHKTRQEGPFQPIYEVNEGQWINFVSDQLDRQSLLQRLEGFSVTAVVAVSNIPYSNTIFERCVLELLNDAQCQGIEGADWLATCHEVARKRPALSVVDLHEIADLAGCRVSVSWARQFSHNGGLDAVFHRYHTEDSEGRVLFRFPTDHLGRNFDGLTNQPLWQRLKRKIEEEVRNKLKSKLPSYMIPFCIRVLDKMPINDNGKIDRRALAKSAQFVKANRSLAARQPPRNHIERVLCQEFASVLVEEVGITDSFYDLGGHSLQAARLVTRINHRLGCKLYVFDILNNSTPAALGEVVSTKIAEEDTNESPWNSELVRQPHSRLTVVLIHGLWGQGSIYTPLVPLLDDVFDVLLLHDPFFGKSAGPETIRQWAELYLNHVEKRVSPEHVFIFGGYSLGGLIAYEMASLWRLRHGQYPALLVLLDAGTYASTTTYAHEKENEKEINYGLTLFGESQKQLILDHFNKIAPLAREPSHLPIYQGECLCLTTSESVAVGALQWWTSRCPGLHSQNLTCSHHALLGEPMIKLVGRLVNEYCGRVVRKMEPLGP